MTIKLNETVVTTLKARLEAELPAIITDINATNTTPPYPIDNIAQVLDYVPTIGDLYQFPTLAISDGPIDLVDDVGWGSTGVFQLSVIAFVQDADQRALAWRLRRTAQAIVRAVRTPINALGDGWGVYDFHVLPGPTLGRDEGPRQFMSTVAVSFMVKTEQDN